MIQPLRVAFVPGVTPDTWAARSRERGAPVELVPVAEADQERVLREHEVDMALVRLPVGRDGLHCVPLYEEQPVVMVGLDHVVSAVDEVSSEDLLDEQLVHPERSGWRPRVPQLDWPATTVAGAVELAASGAGVVVLPMSLARLHHRRDATYRPVTDLPTTTVALAWLVERDDADTQAFVGVTRGRTARSSRG